MGIRIVKLPDVGEGVAEAEVVEWHVTVGQSVLEDQILAAVMTDKATVEIPSPGCRHRGRAGCRGRRRAGCRGRIDLVWKWPAKATPKSLLRRAKPLPLRRLRNRLLQRRHRNSRSRLQRRRPRNRLRHPCRQVARPWSRPGHRARSRLRRRQYAAVHAMRVSICVRCVVRARRAVSAMTISTPSCASARRRQRRCVRQTPRSRPSKSLACAGALRRRWRRPNAGSHTSPMSRKSTLRRSRNCARR